MSCSIFIDDIYHQQFGKKNHYKKNHELLKFQKDLLKTYNQVLEEKSLEQGLQNCFIKMGESLINDLSSDLTKIDLFLLAHDTPDLDPSQSVVNFLTDKYNLNGLCFAMSDYGKNIGVGAIRIASEILQSSNCQKALVMVLDQNTIPSIELNKNDYIDAGLAVLLSKREKSKSILIKGHEQYYFSYKPSLEKVIETFATEDILILNNLEKLEEHKQKYRSSQTLFELSNQIFKESYPSGTPFCLAQFDTDINKLDILKLQF